MAANNVKDVHKTKNNINLAIGLILLILTLAIPVLYILVRNSNQPKTSSNTNKTQNIPKSSNSQSNYPPKQLTAGNVTVPDKYRAKALALGYYCPSWDSKPGEVTPSLCYPINK